MPRLSKIGAAALAAFGWTSGSSVTVTYLQVAGGGGGPGYVGGGGGAGGLLTGTTSLNTSLSYTVTVGAGGAGGIGAGSGANGANGSNSQFGTLTASVGGGAGGSNGGTATGANGGSGGGGSGGASAAGGSGTSGQGNAGGTGGIPTNYGGGGGGGAGAVGSNGSASAGGAGGAGTASSISGSSVTYAGGGGGGTYQGGTAGAGGSGGGGAAGAAGGNNPGTAGTANLGGGGGAASYQTSYVAGGKGGSGIVIISYVGAQQFGGGVVTTDGTNTIHTFTTSGTLVPSTPLTASALVVAGGGGGGRLRGGGGGAGGLRTSTTLSIDTNSIYLVTVGAGGAGSTLTTARGTSGSNSVFSSITSTGGGGGGSAGAASSAILSGASGGSGGGGAADSVTGATFGAGGAGNTPSTSPSQGSNGGSGIGTTQFGGGGGGGASAVGATGLTSGGGAGGAGTASSLSGTSTTYAGGGGGGGQGAGGAGGSGGGGAGASGSSAGSPGTANTGGGGGGDGNPGTNGGTGGSGIVIISYPGSTQQMAGGTVTITGGNVIHTFTSTGYLTPLKYVGNSLRFRSSASAYLSRTPSVASNRQKWTWSGWVKRGSLSSATQVLFGAGQNSTTGINFGFLNTNAFFYSINAVGTWSTTALYRDPAAWYHVVFAFDSTQATQANRSIVYINGVNIAFSSNGVVLNNNYDVNNNILQYHGQTGVGGTPQYLDGYLAEVNFVDGQQLTPSSFGTFNSYGVWQPITYGGSYGTNGFYLPFTNKTSTTTLGYDFSPQGNNWTTNNISLTAGSTYDSMTDVPTLTSATAANYCTLNPLAANSAVTAAQGNLSYTSSNDRIIKSTISATSGKWYWEFAPGGGGSTSGCGAINPSVNIYAAVNLNIATAGVSYLGNGNKSVNGTATSYGATYTSGDVIGVALDLDANTITFYKNNSSQGSISITSGLEWCPAFDQNTGTNYVNFGQRPFTYTPPTGFVALNTYNL